MARMVKGIMATAIVASFMVSSAMAVDYKNKNPTSGFNQNIFNASQLQGIASLNNLSILNGINVNDLANMDFGKMLMNSVVNGVMNQVNAKLLGDIGGIANVGSIFQQNGIGGLTSTFGGLSGASGFGNFGGFEQIATAAVGNLLNQAVNQAIQQAMGGIQGGSSGGGSNFGSYTGGNGTYTQGGSSDTNEDLPLISKNAPVNEDSINYKSGAYDALKGNTLDKRFKFVDDDSYDTNYWAGYEAGLTTLAAMK